MIGNQCYPIFSFHSTIRSKLIQRFIILGPRDIHVSMRIHPLAHYIRRFAIVNLEDREGQRRPRYQAIYLPEGRRSRCIHTSAENRTHRIIQTQHARLP